MSDEIVLPKPLGGLGGIARALTPTESDKLASELSSKGKDFSDAAVFTSSVETPSKSLVNDFNIITDLVANSIDAVVDVREQQLAIIEKATVINDSTSEETYTAELEALDTELTRIQSATTYNGNALNSSGRALDIVDTNMNLSEISGIADNSSHFRTAEWRITTKALATATVTTMGRWLAVDRAASNDTSSRADKIDSISSSLSYRSDIESVSLSDLEAKQTEESTQQPDLESLANNVAKKVLGQKGTDSEDGPFPVHQLEPGKVSKLLEDD